MNTYHDQFIMAGSTDLLSRCSASSFPFPDLPGAELASVIAAPVSNFSGVAPDQLYFGHQTIQATNSTFCNISISYTHPGQDDLINVRAFLPISSPEWNYRFKAVGGGGWSAGMSMVSDVAMIGALGEGYATITTDGGHGGDSGPEDWALASEGNVNLYALQNFASVSLRDEGVIGKSLIEAFYGQSPAYSYWSGCSTGGRQGLMLAQRYPDLYDGIAANAPAINWPSFVGAGYWHKLVQNLYLDGTEPNRCELDELTKKAIAACDELDGLIDGLISDEEACSKVFDPQSLIGESFLCPSENGTMTISEGAVTFAKAIWQGPRAADGSFIWYGRNKAAPLADVLTDIVVEPIGGKWFQYFLGKSSTYDLDSLDLERFRWLVHRGVGEFDSIIGTTDPDLREFERQGHKMITWHGSVSYDIPVVRGGLWRFELLT